MTQPRRRDTIRPLDMLAALWSVPPVSTGAAMAYRTVFLTLRRLLVGKQVTLRAGTGPVTLIVSEMRSPLDLRRLAVGQLDDVRVAATDITWRTSRFAHASAVMHNVHVRPGAPPTLVAAPVELTLEVPTDELDELFVAAVPRFTGAVGADGVARIRFARRPRLGEVEVDAELDGSALFLTPRALTWRRRRWALPVRVPAYRVRLPELPHGLQLTGVGFAPGLLRLSGVLPEWQMEFSRRHFEDLLDS